MLITAIGVSLFLEYTGRTIRLRRRTPKISPKFFRNIFIAHRRLVSFSDNQIVVISVTLLLLLALRFIVLKTKIGTAMRAVSFNPQAAALMGVNIDVVISFTFGLGSALAAAGGILYSP